MVSSKSIKKPKNIEIAITVKPIEQSDEAKEKAMQETRKLMDDIWQRYPKAEVSKFNSESNNVIFEVK